MIPIMYKFYIFIIGKWRWIVISMATFIIKFNKTEIEIINNDKSQFNLIFVIDFLLVEYN